MGQVLARRVGETWELGDLEIGVEDTRETVNRWLREEGGLTCADLIFSGPDEKAAFEARFGPI